MVNPNIPANSKGDEWLHLTRDLEDWIMQNPDNMRRGEISEQVHAFRGDINMILRLQCAFHSSPKRAVEGDRSVTSQLGMSKSAVHIAIHKLGLSTNSFREPTANLQELISTSAVVQEKLRAIKLLHQEIFSS